MTRFTTFLALMVGGMEVVQPVGVLGASLTARMRLGQVGVDRFQRRQGSVIPTCNSVCTPIFNPVISNNCTPSDCCSVSFEEAYFECFVCIAAVIDVTDYTGLQSDIDELYDQCAELGIALLVLTFPGQNPNRTLSSVAPQPSQTTVATITFAPPPPVFPTTINPTLPTTTSATSTQAPLPKSSSSFGIRSAETSCFNLIVSAIMLELWSYFAIQ